jgi:hypothetical protein
MSSGAQTEIKSGLKAGDEIVVPQLPVTSGTGDDGRNGSFPGGGNVPGGNIPVPPGDFPGNVVVGGSGG